MATFIISKVIFILSLLLIWLFLMPVFFKPLWNTTLPELFDVKTISYWQAFRLMLIGVLLFGGGFLSFQF